MRKEIVIFKFIIGYLFGLLLSLVLLAIPFNSVLEYFTLLFVVSIGFGLYISNLLANILKEEANVQNKID